MKRLLKTIAFVGFLLSALVLVSMLPGQAAVQTPSEPVDEETVISISPAENSVSPSSTFTVTVAIDTAPASRAAQFSLTFDPQVLECVSISEGSFYVDWATANGGSTFIFPEPECDNVNGEVTMMGITILEARTDPSPGHAGGPTGSGELANILFKAVGEDASEVILVDVVVADDSLEAKALPVTIQDGSVTVESDLDLYLPLVIRQP